MDSTYNVENTNGNVNSVNASDQAYRGKMLAYVMDKLDALAQYPAYIENAIVNLGNMNINECPNGGDSDAARASAIGNSIAAREETNRALIEFLKQIYNDVKPDPQIYKPIPQDNQKSAVYQSIAELIGRIDPDTDNASDLLDTARLMLGNIG